MQNGWGIESGDCASDFADGLGCFGFSVDETNDVGLGRSSLDTESGKAAGDEFSVNEISSERALCERLGFNGIGF